MGSRKMHRGKAALALACLLVFLSGCGSAERPEAAQGDQTEPDRAYAALCEEYAGVVPSFVFTYADNQTSEYPTTMGAYYFAEAVHERTQGRIQILVYANAGLGEEVETVRQVSFGGIDFVRATVSTLLDYSEEVPVLMMPYLYRDREHMWQVLDGDIGDEIMDSFQGSGLVPLSWYDAGARSFYTKEPVRNPEDLKGLRIRVQEVEAMEEMIRLLGAEPVPVEYKDVYSALETGRVDGAENNFSSYETMGHDRVAPFYTLDEHMRVPEMQLMSAETASKLSAEDMQIIEECARESAVYERKLWQEHEARAREAVEGQGCTVTELTDAEKQAFRELVMPLYEVYCSGHMDLIGRITEAGAP